MDFQQSKLDWLVQLEQIGEKVALAAQCRLYDLEFSGIGAGRTLRLYIDKEDEQVSLDDCANVSRLLSEQLDVEDVVPGGPYHLEVSTPGLDRSLKKHWHFQKAVGKKIWLKTVRPLSDYGVDLQKWKSAKTVEQVLHSVSDKDLTFKVKDGDLVVPFQAIDKAKLVFEMTKGQKK